MKNILFWLLMIINLSLYSQETPPPQNSKNGNFSKSEFNKNSSWSNNGKASSAPPHPGSGGHGNRIDNPISSGIWILIVGSAIYLIIKIKKEKDFVI